MKTDLHTLFPLLFQALSWGPTRLIFLVFRGLEIRGLENLKSIGKTGVIFASNHGSDWDAVLISAALPFFSRLRPVYYVSRDSSFYIHSSWRKPFYGGLFFKIMGAYPAYSGLKDYEKALAHHIFILSKNKTVFIFPEGRKMKTDELGEAKGGIAFLAQKTKVPVIPIGITGMSNIGFLSFFYRKDKVVISFGEPLREDDIFPDNKGLETKKTDPETYKKGATIIMDKIKTLLEI